MKVKSLGTGLNSRMKGKQQKEKRKANELEDRTKEITPIWRGKNGWKNIHSLRGLCDYKKISNICVIRTQEGMIKEGRKKHWKKRWLSIALKGFVNLCVCVCVCVWIVNHVQLFETPWTVALPAPLSMGFSRQEYWSGLHSSRGSFQPRDRACVSCAASGFFTISATMEAPSVKLNKPQTR